ncbi:MAG: hypothetical protein K1V77_01310 [Muribaculaceae bacterium]
MKRKQSLAVFFISRYKISKKRNIVQTGLLCAIRAGLEAGGGEDDDKLRLLASVG